MRIKTEAPGRDRFHTKTAAKTPERQFSPGQNSAQVIPLLQQTLGNKAFQRLVSPQPQSSFQASGQVKTLVERYPFQIAIRHDPHAGNPQTDGSPQQRLDSMPGEEQSGDELKALFSGLGEEPQTAMPQTAGTEENTTSPVENAETTTPAPTAEETKQPPADGASAPIAIPDIELPVMETVEKTDSVNPRFAYSSSITKGGAAPAGFGVTRSFNAKLTNLSLFHFFNFYIVTGAFEHPITYQIRSGVGPDSQVDIASDADSDISKANYADVAADLTPNMGDLNGRPPRKHFWAEDLTTRHELVHCHDDQKNGPDAMRTSLTWLSSQSASSDAGVRLLLTKIPGRFAAALLAALSTVDGEKHAYGDGAPAYKARADAIKAKGDKGGYK